MIARGLNKTILTFVAVLVGLVSMSPAQTFAADPGVTDSEVVIGSKAIFTGPLSIVGTNFRMATELALDQINSKGGVNGRKMRIIWEDDTGTAEGGIAAARRLIDRESVFMIFDGGTSTSVPPVIPLYRRGEIPVLTPTATDPRVVEPVDPKIFMGAGVALADWMPAFAKLLVQLNAKRVALITCDQAHCPSSAIYLPQELKRNGIEVVASEKYKVGDVNYSAQIAAIQKSNPDAVVLFGFEGSKLVPAMKRAGITATLVGDPIFADKSLIERTGNSTEGLYALWIGGTQFIEDTTGAMGAFRKAWFERYPDAPKGTPSLHAALAYADVFVIAEAIRRAGKEPTRKGFLAGLESLNGFIAGRDDAWKDIAFPIGLPRSYTKDNHRGTQGPTVVIVKDGNFVTAPGW